MYIQWFIFNMRSSESLAMRDFHYHTAKKKMLYWYHKLLIAPHCKCTQGPQALLIVTLMYLAFSSNNFLQTSRLIDIL